MINWLNSKIKKYYTQMSMEFLISLSFTLIAIVGIIIIAAVLMFTFIRSSQEIHIKKQDEALVYVQRNIDNFLRSTMTLSDTVYYNIIKNEDINKTISSEKLNLLYTQNKSNISSIALLNSGGSVVLSAPMAQPKALSRAAFTSWFKTALGKVENLHFGFPNVENLFENTDNTYKWVIPLSRFVRFNIEGKTDSGVLVVNISAEALKLLCSEISNDNLTVYLITKSGELIAHPHLGNIYANIEPEPSREYALLPDGTHRLDDKNISIRTIGYTGWRVISVSDSFTLEQFSFQIIVYGASVLILVLFLMLFINFRISKYISKPLMELELSVRSLEDNNEIAICENCCYEVRNLGNTIHQVVSTMRKLMDDVLEQERQKRLWELEVLQSQINPHFLYNTLDSVIWLTENERNEEAVEMISALARIFRISLSKGKNKIPLHQEFAHARSYLDIQKIRYKNRFSYDINLPDDLAEYITLKLIIQPILENAIYHGLSEDECLITITAYEINEYDIIIEVSDTGIGIPEEILEKLLSDEQANKQSKGSGVALVNIDRRIKLSFGEKYGLSIDSVPDEGTSVKITLPKTKE